MRCATLFGDRNRRIPRKRSRRQSERTQHHPRRLYRTCRLPRRPGGVDDPRAGHLRQRRPVHRRVSAWRAATGESLGQQRTTDPRQARLFDAFRRACVPGAALPLSQCSGRIDQVRDGPRGGVRGSARASRSCEPSKRQPLLLLVSLHHLRPLSRGDPTAIRATRGESADLYRADFRRYRAADAGRARSVGLSEEARQHRIRPRQGHDRGGWLERPRACVSRLPIMRPEQPAGPLASNGPTTGLRIIPSAKPATRPGPRSPNSSPPTPSTRSARRGRVPGSISFPDHSALDPVDRFPVKQHPQGGLHAIRHSCCPPGVSSRGCEARQDAPCESRKPNPVQAVDERRRVLFEGAVNFRDLGGYPHGDGRRTRWEQPVSRGQPRGLDRSRPCPPRGLGAEDADRLPHSRRSARPAPTAFRAGSSLRRVELGFLPAGTLGMLELVKSGTISPSEIERRVIAQYRLFCVDHIRGIPSDVRDRARRTTAIPCSSTARAARTAPVSRPPCCSSRSACRAKLFSRITI